MSESTKSQFYRYSMRTIMFDGAFWCTKRIGLEVVPPDNAQSIENLFCHLKIVFESSLPTAQKALARIGVISKFPQYGKEATAARYRYLQIDKAAVGDELELFIDLTSLLDKQAVGAPGSDNQTIVWLEAAGSVGDILEASAGNIYLWKLDAIYTTREIR